MNSPLRPGSWLERLFAGHHDILAALRSLRRSPGFVVIAVLSLGLAIGLNTTTFAMLDAITNPYLPFTHAEQLFTVQPIGARTPAIPDVGGEMYVEMRGRHELYQALVPWGSRYLTVEAGNHLVSGTVATVGSEMFQVLGARPELGRTFNPAGGDDGAAVISHELWKNQLSGRANIDSLTVTVQSTTYRVIGVMPPAMMYPSKAVVWLAMPTEMERSMVGTPGIAGLLRTRSGDNAGRVAAQLTALASGIANAVGLDHKLFGYSMTPLRTPAGPVRDIQKALAGASLLILLVACLNLANLMLVRGLGRRREVAVRMAVGASGAAIMRYVLAEAAVLAVGGGAWGVMLSLWGVNLAQYRMPQRLAEFGFFAPHIGWRVVAAGVLVTASTVLIAGLLPALHAKRADVNDLIKDGGGASTARRNRAYTLLAVGQVALALMVMMGSGLLLRDVQEYAHRPLNFDAAHVLSASVAPPNDSMCSTSAGKHFMYDLATRIKTVPGIRYASVTGREAPVHMTYTSDILGIQRSLGPYVITTPEYYRAQGIKIAEGRDFEPGDLDSEGAVILSHDVAVTMWGKMSPVGHMLKLGPKKVDAPWLRVVGVTAVSPDTVNGYVYDLAPPVVVVGRDECGSVSVYARTDNQDPRTPIALFHALRAAVPSALVGPVRSERGSFDEQMGSIKMVAILFTAFGVFGLALAAFGVYGVLSYIVSQRMREFAMRIALGAKGAELRRLVLREAWVIALGGTAIGAWGAMWGGTYLNQYLYRVAFSDVFALVGAEGILIGVILVSCVAPALRAMRANPLDLLRAT